MILMHDMFSWIFCFLFPMLLNLVDLDYCDELTTRQNSDCLDPQPEANILRVA